VQGAWKSQNNGSVVCTKSCKELVKAINLQKIAQRACKSYQPANNLIFVFFL